MNPRTAECFGLYGYGNGYFARGAEQKRRTRHQREVAGFCNSCPTKQGCWQEHKRRVEEAQPVQTVAFIAAMDQAKAAGDPQAGRRLAARMAVEGQPDPWMAGMLENMQRGMADREAPAHGN